MQCKRVKMFNIQVVGVLMKLVIAWILQTVMEHGPLASINKKQAHGFKFVLQIQKLGLL